MPKVRCVALARALGGSRRARGGVARRQGRGHGRDGEGGGGGKLLEGAHWVVDAIHNIPTKEPPCCHERETKQAPHARPKPLGPLHGCRRQIRPHARPDRRHRDHGVGPPHAPCASASGAAAFPQACPSFTRSVGVLDEWRVRILPVLGPLPAIFALHVATHVLSERTGKPLANPLAIQNRRKLYERMLRDLQAREADRAGRLLGVSPDEDDVTLLFEDVHRRRNVVPPHAVPVKPTLVRWDSARPLGVENVVVMNVGEAGM
ncbi:hypothetical protein DFH08DRAFT_986188 [Mycena albidolilacea]|uniref:Uncharacterized protein n=1 Tax=Mycena albidolilacea TaxID=1033008 RepID=A0AAD6Z1N8_9AGAR|nr:hypothetical protein DFH08DRAFT_986188 [Mycena albidolilacea]